MVIFGPCDIPSVLVMIEKVYCMHIFSLNQWLCDRDGLSVGCSVGLSVGQSADTYEMITQMVEYQLKMTTHNI